MPGRSTTSDGFRLPVGLKPAGEWVGRPSYHDERAEWLMYAFDPSEKAVVGKHSREWTAIGPTEDAVVREMARCLREIAAGRAPR